MTSACALPCAQEGARCVLLGRRALLMARCPQARDRAAAVLGLLGLHVLHACPDAGGAAVLPAHVDIAVCADPSDLRAAGDLVDLLRDERPWVPLLVATGGGQAALVDLDHPNWPPPRVAGDFATLVVRAACRTARHGRVPGRAAEILQPTPPAI